MVYCYWGTLEPPVQNVVLDEPSSVTPERWFSSLIGQHSPKVEMKVIEEITETFATISKCLESNNKIILSWKVVSMYVSKVSTSLRSLMPHDAPLRL